MPIFHMNHEYYNLFDPVYLVESDYKYPLIGLYILDVMEFVYSNFLHS